MLSAAGTICSKLTHRDVTANRYISFVLGSIRLRYYTQVVDSLCRTKGRFTL